MATRCVCACVCVCVCVCLCVIVCVCMYIYICVCMYIYMCVCVYVCSCVEIPKEQSLNAVRELLVYCSVVVHAHSHTSVHTLSDEGHHSFGKHRYVVRVAVCMYIVSLSLRCCVMCIGVYVFVSS